ncbi:MAG: response regulator [Verrucomicrobia bacterium]|nr:response regulator [Verrucomicrobiota bacterium]
MMPIDPISPKEHPKGHILVVEDDPMGAAFFQSSLVTAGFSVDLCSDARKAVHKLTTLGCDNFDAVLTDYRMPGMNGLDLLHWINAQDQTLSTVMVTAQGERDLIKQSMSTGARDFLDKPVTHQQLTSVIEKAVQQTRRLRHFENTQQSLAAAGRMDHLFSNVRAEELNEFIDVRHVPLHEVGGDFLNIFKVGPGKFSAVIGDVSGHDVKAAFVSSYFQGLLRGFSETQTSALDAICKFNDILVKEWDERNTENRLITSPTLSVALFEIDIEQNLLKIFSCGFPPVYICDQDGFIHTQNIGSFPIGWMPDCQPEEFAFDMARGSCLLAFTDGLMDLAIELEINTLSLLFVLFRENLDLKNGPLQAVDDILVLRYQFNCKVPTQSLFHPIIQEQYTGADVDDMDRIEAVWRRSLQFSLQEELGDRLFELLICIREGVINAMIHGCERSSEKVCTLTMTYNPEKYLVRVRIDDPGKGHNFDLQKRLKELANPDGKHLGLGIIQHLSDSFSIENKGSTLIFDFFLTPAQS